MLEALDRIPPHLRKSLRNVGIGYIVWVVVSIAGWIYLPSSVKWVAYGPLVFPVAAVIITGIILARQKFAAKPIASVYIRGKRVSSCRVCPMGESKENPVASAFPIVSCRETAKTCYNADAIQKWCPYAPERRE